MRAVIWIVVLVLGVVGCGVKGDPVAPETPVELGRGKPTFKRALKNIDVEKSRLKDIDDEESERDEDESD